MKKITLLLVLAFGISGSLTAQNLLLNASGEETDTNGTIPHWTPTIGGTWLNSIYTGTYPEVGTPTAGVRFFYPAYSYANVDGQSTSEIGQIVDIASDATIVDSGNMNYYFEGYTISFDQQPADISNFIIEFLDASDVVLQTNQFGPFSFTANWHHVVQTINAPANARKVHVKMRSVLINGSSCDGLYEDLYFARTPLLGTEKNSKSAFKVYPNPVQEKLYINSALAENQNIQLLDVAGKIVKSFENKNAETQLELPMDDVPNGLYFLKINGNGYSETRKIIKN